MWKTLPSDPVPAKRPVPALSVTSDRTLSTPASVANTAALAPGRAHLVDATARRGGIDGAGPVDRERVDGALPGVRQHDGLVAGDAHDLAAGRRPGPDEDAPIGERDGARGRCPGVAREGYVAESPPGPHDAVGADAHSLDVAARELFE